MYNFDSCKQSDMSINGVYQRRPPGCHRSLQASDITSDVANDYQIHPMGNVYNDYYTVREPHRPQLESQQNKRPRPSKYITSSLYISSPNEHINDIDEYSYTTLLCDQTSTVKGETDTSRHISEETRQENTIIAYNTVYNGNKEYGQKVSDIKQLPNVPYTYQSDIPQYNSSNMVCVSDPLSGYEAANELLRHAFMYAASPSSSVLHELNKRDITTTNTIATTNNSSSVPPYEEDIDECYFFSSHFPVYTEMEFLRVKTKLFADEDEERCAIIRKWATGEGESLSLLKAEKYRKTYTSYVPARISNSPIFEGFPDEISIIPSEASNEVLCQELLDQISLPYNGPRSMAAFLGYFEVMTCTSDKVIFASDSSDIASTPIHSSALPTVFCMSLTNKIEYLEWLSRKEIEDKTTELESEIAEAMLNEKMMLFSKEEYQRRWGVLQEWDSESMSLLLLYEYIQRSTIIMAENDNKLLFGRQLAEFPYNISKESLDRELKYIVDLLSYADAAIAKESNGEITHNITEDEITPTMRGTEALAEAEHDNDDRSDSDMGTLLDNDGWSDVVAASLRTHVYEQHSEEEDTINGFEENDDIITPVQHMSQCTSHVELPESTHMEDKVDILSGDGSDVSPSSLPSTDRDHDGHITLDTQSIDLEHMRHRQSSNDNDSNIHLAFLSAAVDFMQGDWEGVVIEWGKRLLHERIRESHLGAATEQDNIACNEQQTVTVDDLDEKLDDLNEVRPIDVSLQHTSSLVLQKQEECIILPEIVQQLNSECNTSGNNNLNFKPLQDGCPPVTISRSPGDIDNMYTSTITTISTHAQTEPFVVPIWARSQKERDRWVDRIVTIIKEP